MIIVNNYNNLGCPAYLAFLKYSFANPFKKKDSKATGESAPKGGWEEIFVCV